jgi:hypothetical protein
MEKQIGLIYNTSQMGENPSWLLDSTSIETFGSSWTDFGYEIIYRPQEIRATTELIEELKKTFMKPFGLSDKHYRFEPTFWRVYWDRGQLRVNLLHESEKGLDRVARENNLALMLNDVIIQPRPVGYIRKMVELNK